MRRTLLIVSHNQQVRSAIKSLRGPDVRVLETATGLGALCICACQPVDLLVIDRDTPGMDWPRLLEKLSAAFPEMPVLSTTASGGPGALGDRIREALADGAALRRQRPQPARQAAARSGEQRQAS